MGRGREPRPRRRARPPGRRSCASGSPSTGSPAWAIASCTAGSSTRRRCASTRRCSTRSRSTSRSRRCTSRTTSRRSARCSSGSPQLPQVACFDTAFHRGQPPVAQAFALPQGDHRPRRAALRLPRPVVRVHRAACCRGIDARAAAGRTVVLHLGNGSSMCAIAAGRSVASTMGFTAVDGLPMGTRCGSARSGRLLYLMDELRHGRARDREAHLPAVGPARRVGHLERHAHAARPATTRGAKAAIDLYVYRIGRELGSLAAALGGLDALVFTAGIGENSAALRERVCRDAAWLGVELDAAANARRRPAHQHRRASRAAAWVDPDQRGADDRAPHADACWALRTASREERTA